MNLAFYNIDIKYIDYLSSFAPHLFLEKDSAIAKRRKYIGILLEIDEIMYFAPLSSYKPKHRLMKDSVDFVKLREYAVVNINNMFPVPDGIYSFVDFSAEKDKKYRDLLIKEYRIIKKLQDRIVKNARIVRDHRIRYGDTTALGKRCNDFILLEAKCIEYARTKTEK